MLRGFHPRRDDIFQIVRGDVSCRDVDVRVPVVLVVVDLPEYHRMSRVAGLVGHRCGGLRGEDVLVVSELAFDCDRAGVVAAHRSPD